MGDPVTPESQRKVVRQTDFQAKFRARRTLITTEGVLRKRFAQFVCVELGIKVSARDCSV
jgi:hypothetical protein